MRPTKTLNRTAQGIALAALFLTVIMAANGLLSHRASATGALVIAASPALATQ